MVCFLWTSWWKKNPRTAGHFQSVCEYWDLSHKKANPLQAAAVEVLCVFTAWGQLRWHHQAGGVHLEWTKPGVVMGCSSWASVHGICRNMVLGKSVFTCLTGAGSLVPVHRNCLCLFFGGSSPRRCDVITQGTGVTRLQMLLTGLCNYST